MRRLARLLLLSSALVVCAPHANGASEDGSPSDFNRLVDAVVAQYRLPGIAVGVIDDGKVVYTRTVGELQSGQPINTDTLFKIASNSKAMTATLLARLVEEGKLHWDDPVTKYLPSFRMYDPWVTKNMQVADMVFE
jgi:CubicO group peptidase (beta-lactamase class C family)